MEPMSAAPQSRVFRILPLVLMCLFGFLIARYLPAFRPLHDASAKSKPIVPRGDLAEDEKATIELFKNRAPSVVFITTSRYEMDFFSAQRKSGGAGSGFIWDDQGHIVTNYHVIAESDEATVILSNANQYAATLIGRAPGKDLAVLRIDAPAKLLQPIQVGSSENLLVGQNVFAIGNPFGLDYTLTTGIISALDRQIKTDGSDVQRTISGVIQTDAAINPGNSGGPLLDSAGNLIGVNTAIYSPSGAYAGIGFAIPSGTVNRIVPQLIRYGKIIRPTIGIDPYRVAGGILIGRMERNSPADRAGLRPTRYLRARRGFQTILLPGDLITQADDVKIGSLDDWYTFLESKKAGETVRLTIIRDPFSQKKRMKVDVTLEEEP